MDYTRATITSTDTNRKCLVCSQTFNSSNFPDNCSGNAGVLRNQLKVVLLLRKVLRIPQSALLNLLKKLGSPSDWNVSLCGPCSSIFREAEFIHRRILKFNADFEQLATELRCLMQESTKGAIEEPDRNDSKGQGNEKSQKKLTPRRRKGRGRGRPPKPKPTDEIEPTSFTALESLRQAFLHNHQDQGAAEESHKIQCRTLSIVVERNPIEDDTFNRPFINTNNSVSEENEYTSDNVVTEDRNDDFHFLRPHTSTTIKQEKDSNQNVNNNDDDFNVEDEDPDPDWAVNDNDIDETVEGVESDNDDVDWTENCSSRSRRCPKRKMKSVEQNSINKSNHDSSGKSPQIPDDILKKFYVNNERIYDCKQCSRSFNSEMLREAHVKRLHQGIANAFPCEHCHRSFPRRTILLRHVANIHFGNSHVCPHCATGFGDEILKEAHIRRVHLGDPNPFRCTVDGCPIKFQRRAKLSVHLYEKHGVSLPKVTKMKTHAPTVGIPRLRKSKKSPTQKKEYYECSLCTLDDGTQLRVRNKKEMTKHVEKQHKGISRPYPCSICERRFSRPWIVEQHMQIHTVRNDVAVDDHPPDVFICVPCNKQFSKQQHLDTHLEGKRHQNNRPYVCEICSQSFRGARCLQNHQILQHYKELNKTPFKCKFCDKILGSERRLDAHIRVCHTKDANYSCPHCDQQFQHESTMLRHINVRHTKSEKFVCSQCPKSFLDEQYLGYHVLRVHSGEKPYECKYCQKRFSDKPTYNRHVEWHSDVVHDCPHCSKTGFKTRHALRVHVRTCHKELLDASPINQKQRNSTPIVQSEASSQAEESTVASTELLNNWS